LVHGRDLEGVGGLERDKANSGSVQTLRQRFGWDSRESWSDENCASGTGSDGFPADPEGNTSGRMKTRRASAPVPTLNGGTEVRLPEGSKALEDGLPVRSRGVMNLDDDGSNGTHC
jgi:hypothetical protein